MGKRRKSRRFQGGRDQDSRLRCNYSNNYNYLFSVVSEGASWFCEKMGKMEGCGFWGFFNVLRPRAEISILNVFKDSFSSR